MSPIEQTRVGELRPSQLLWSFGCGALVDLPNISVIVMGLDYWRTERSVPIPENRLLGAVQRVLGPQVSRLLAPPIVETDGPIDPFSEEARIGVPVNAFPRWLRCPICQMLGEIDSGLFELKPSPYRPDRTKFVHANCNRAKSPIAVPARFLAACRNGHLDDFPWHWFVHGGPSGCRERLTFYEEGASLQTENLWVRCTCGQARPMNMAFGESGQRTLPACRGRHPQLGVSAGDCDEQLRAVLLGASNSWFPVTMSVLSIPTKGGRLGKLVEDKWFLLKDIPSKDVLPLVLNPLLISGQLPGFEEFEMVEIWEAIAEKRAQEEGEAGAGEEEYSFDFKTPEWEVFTSSKPPSDFPDFMVRKVDPPPKYSGYIKGVLLAERLREVNALIGFTRVEPPDEGREGGQPPPRAPLSRSQPQWVPANEVRGEGIFLQFDPKKLEQWLSRDVVKGREKELLKGHRGWRSARRLEPPDANFPGMVYVLLHSIAHLLIRELALECGYSAASIRERIYASSSGTSAEKAGILLYTAAPDSDGTLGGLVSLGRPDNLEKLIDQALERARICSSDPLCAEHEAANDRTLHGAACHACLFVSETSCERGNRYLDRALVVPTFQSVDVGFFDLVTP